MNQWTLVSRSIIKELLAFWLRVWPTCTGKTRTEIRAGQWVPTQEVWQPGHSEPQPVPVPFSGERSKDLLPWLSPACIPSLEGFSCTSLNTDTSHQCDLDPGNQALGRHFWTRGRKKFSESYSLQNWKQMWNWEWRWTLATETKDHSDALESNCPIRKLFLPFYWWTSLY